MLGAKAMLGAQRTPGGKEPRVGFRENIRGR